MTSIGEILRQERLKQARSLGEIAEETKIGQRYLEAIETDKLDWLPGTFFYKNFVRQYAIALGIPPERLAGPLEEFLGPPPETKFTAESFPLKPLDPIVMDTNRRFFSDRRVAWPFLALLVVAFGCAGLYAWWHKTQFERPADAIAAMTDAMETTQAATVPTSAPPEPRQAEPLPQEAVEAPSAAALVANSAPAVSPADGWKIDVSATEKTWLSIASGGKNLFSGVLEPSQSKTLAGQKSARLLVGNAGGIEIVWNGKLIGPLGSRGQVCTVVFTRDNYRILPTGHPL